MKKMTRIFWIIGGVILLIIIGSFIIRQIRPVPTITNLAQAVVEQTQTINPLSIEYLRQQSYPGSPIEIEQTLTPGSNYQRYIASYQSDGLKIRGLLTIPNGQTPTDGWPAIVFNHGYIAPSEYKTTERYVAYVDNLARSQYVVFKIDYRGHDQSEGQPTGAYTANGYLSDVLNAYASLQQHPSVNPQKIGMWGHSMGGFLTVKSMVISPDIKVGVIWGGVVGSYDSMINNWRRPSNSPQPTRSPGQRRSLQELAVQYGGTDVFWDQISAIKHLDNVSGPIQLHHGLADETVPYAFSEEFYQAMRAAGKETEYHAYPGNDHNISQSFNLAMRRTIEYFDKYLK